MTTAALRLPEALYRQLEDVARARKRPKSAILREALEAYLEEWAEYQVALDRLNDPKDRVLTVEEFYGALGRKPPKP